MDLMQLLNLLVHADKALDALLTNFGPFVYAILFAIVFCETGLVVLFFFPGDTLLFIGGAYCAAGKLSYSELCALLVAAAVLGNTLNYWIGSRIGQRVFTHNYRWINKDALQRTHDFFDRHGGKTIILARFVPVVRTFAPFVAGVSAMTHTRFQMFNITGAALWVFSLVTAGYFVGDNAFVKEHLTVIVLSGIGAAVIPMVLGGLYKFALKLRKG